MVRGARAGYEFGMRAVSIAASWIALSVISLLASAASADPVVVVHVRRGGSETAEATVFLRDANGIVGTCRTESGTCEIRGVPPGRHTVSAQGDAGTETPGRPVMIPPDGKVSLIVAVP